MLEHLLQLGSPGAGGRDKKTFVDSTSASLVLIVDSLEFSSQALLARAIALWAEAGRETSVLCLDQPACLFCDDAERLLLPRIQRRAGQPFQTAPNASLRSLSSPSSSSATTDIAAVSLPAFHSIPLRTSFLDCFSSPVAAHAADLAALERLLLRSVGGGVNAGCGISSRSSSSSSSSARSDSISCGGSSSNLSSGGGGGGNGCNGGSSGSRGGGGGGGGSSSSSSSSSSSNSSGSRDVLLIDSLSVLLLRHGAASVCAWLRRLAQSGRFHSVFAVLHADAHTHHERLVETLEYAASSIITLTAPTQLGYTVVCSVVCKRPSGKLSHSTEWVRADSAGRWVASPAPLVGAVTTTTTTTSVRGGVSGGAGASASASASAPPNNVGDNGGRGDATRTVAFDDDSVRGAASAADTPLPDNVALMSMLTSFKLHLTDHEKRARSEVVLPFHSAQNLGGGLIYVEDENADIDEEDPDDDLDL